MAAISVSCIVWCYVAADSGRPIPYPPEVSRELENYYQSGRYPSHTVTVSGQSCTVSFTYPFTQTAVKHSRRRTTVHRTPVSLPHSPDIMAYWEWDSGRGVYSPYAVNATVDIELAYLSRSPSIDLSRATSGIPYTVDLRTMQQHSHIYGTLRAVRRVTLLLPLQTLLQEQSPSMAASFSSPATALLASTSKRPSSKTKPTSCKRSSPSSTSSVPSSASTSRSSSVSSTSSKRASSVTSSRTSGVSSSSKAGDGTGRPVTRSKSKGAASTALTAASPSLVKSADSSVASSSDNLLIHLGPLRQFVKIVSALNAGEDGPCPICMNNFSEMSGFEEELDIPTSFTVAAAASICKLRKCNHLIHFSCLVMYTRNSSDSKGCIRCPTCKVIHGERRGDMPSTGTMTVTKRHYSLPGHEGYDAIEIVYNFRPGVHNGIHYRANGFPRQCYLPDSPKGNKVLKLLKVAWDRGLTFTIGTSVTTGATNTIVWNEIHHKTESFSNISGHGYPDDNYLDNVLGELAAQGVVDNEETV